MDWGLIAYLYLLGFCATGAVLAAVGNDRPEQGLPAPASIASVAVVATLWPLFWLYVAAARLRHGTDQ